MIRNDMAANPELDFIEKAVSALGLDVKDCFLLGYCLGHPLDWGH